MPDVATTRDPRPAQAVADLRAIRFHIRRKGYDIAEVDQLLQGCLQRLERMAVSAPADGGDPEAERAWRAFWKEEGTVAADEQEVITLIESTKLHARRKGYDPAEVDAALAQLVATLTGPLGDPSGGPAAPASAAASPSATATAVDSSPAPTLPQDPLRDPSPGLASATSTGALSTVGSMPAPPWSPIHAEHVPVQASAGPLAGAGEVEAPPVGAERDLDDDVEGLEDRFVRHVVDASLRTARGAADAADVRREAGRLLERVQEARVAEVERAVAGECRNLRDAAVEQCESIVAEARAEADRTLSAVSARVDEQLARVRRDAAEELDRILADERAKLAALVGSLAVVPTSTAPVTDLPRRPQVDRSSGSFAWNDVAVTRQGARVAPLYPDERAPSDGGHDRRQEYRS